MHIFRSKKIWLSLLLAPFTSLFSLSNNTWVSGTGSGVTCSRSSPCATFSIALGQTNAGGEINAVDSGNFQNLTINKSITIDGQSTIATILGPGGPSTIGITINAGATDVVILRNLDINGLGTTVSGIQFNTGAQLIIENCTIYGFIFNGIEINSAKSQVIIDNCTISNLATGIKQSSSASTTVTNTLITQATTAIDIETGTCTISECVITQNSTGVLGNGGVVDCVNSVLTNNSVTAIQSNGSCIVRISNNGIFNNGIGLSGTGTIATSNTNRVKGNGSTVAPNTTIVYQ